MPLHRCLKDKTIDILFLDNTFLSPIYDGFSNRKDAVAATVAVLRANPTSTCIIAMDVLGKEAYLRDIGLEMACKIAIQPEDFCRLPLLDDPSLLTSNVFTTDATAVRGAYLRSLSRCFHRFLAFPQTRIKVEPKNKSHRPHLLSPNTVVIYPSAWGLGRALQHPGYVVRYSLHSSFSELIACLRAVSACCRIVKWFGHRAEVCYCSSNHGKSLHHPSQRKLHVKCCSRFTLQSAQTRTSWQQHHPRQKATINGALRANVLVTVRIPRTPGV
jgi:hypothetical protein